VNSKPWYLSRTVWGAVLYFLLALAKAFGIEGADAGKWDQAIEVAAGAIAMVVLRKMTTEPMHFTEPKA
jgi:hypothetical protein